MKKIVLTTTFRSFEGNKNDRLQQMFLKSLSRQTYQNFILVVTIFKEKNVEESVKEILGDKAVFIYTQISENYRYSPTKVVLNGVEYGIKNNYDILVDCSGDIVLQDNMLEIVSKHFSPMYSGISHPNIFGELDESFRFRDKCTGSCGRGIDLRFFDMQLLNSTECKERLETYALYDWGGIEHLLFGISQPLSKRMINIFEESKVIKVENDRESANENNEYIQKSGERNRSVLKKLSDNIGMEYTDLLNLLYIHEQYKLTKNKIRNFWRFRKERKVYLEQRLKKREGFLNKILLALIHWIL